MRRQAVVRGEAALFVKPASEWECSITAARRKAAARSRSRGFQIETRIDRELAATLDPEIQRLIADQERDRLTLQVAYGPSLDERLEGDDDGSYSLARHGGVVFDRDEDAWPYFAERGRRRGKRSAS